MATIRTTFTLDEALSQEAKDLGINVSEAARVGVVAAVEEKLRTRDREAYLANPEQVSTFWSNAEAWGEQ
ncbi:MAG: type II toxin-antitoxin system CcdA family antitoxin [Acidimicrobiales bacterium]|nr:type II toxin-antitoxin system CcdA family antitoxin [Acidimicrobiales bacterium]